MDSFMKLYRGRRETALSRKAEMEARVQSAARVLERFLKRSFHAGLIFVCCLLLISVVLEGAFRIFGYEERALFWMTLRQAYPSIKTHPRRVWTAQERVEEVFVHSPTGRPAPVKILFLGDPNASRGLSDPKDGVPSLLGNILSREGRASVVYNVLTGGYGPEQEFSFLTEEVLPELRPDIVIWSYEFSDYALMKSLPMHVRTRDALYRIPVWLQGAYWQGAFCENVYRFFPRSRACHWIALMLGKLSAPSLFMPINDYEIALLLNRMVDDVARKEIPVLFIKSPTRWNSLHPEESRKWAFIGDLQRLLPFFMDADEEFHGVLKNRGDAETAASGLFESETLLAAEGRRAYAEMIARALKRNGL